MNGRFIGGLLVGILLAAPAAAKTRIWECKITMDARSSFIGRNLVIAHALETGQVTVDDEIIEGFIGNPIAGRNSVSKPDRIVYNWSVQTHNDSGQSADIAYSARINPATSAINVTATPFGYSNMFEGKGTCTASERN